MGIFFRLCPLDVSNTLYTIPLTSSYRRAVLLSWRCISEKEVQNLQGWLSGCTGAACSSYFSALHNFSLEVAWVPPASDSPNLPERVFDKILLIRVHCSSDRSYFERGNKRSVEKSWKCWKWSECRHRQNCRQSTVTHWGRIWGGGRGWYKCCQMAKFDPFLSGRERKGSNFAAYSVAEP